MSSSIRSNITRFLFHTGHIPLSERIHTTYKTQVCQNFLLNSILHSISKLNMKWLKIPLTIITMNWQVGGHYANINYMAGKKLLYTYIG